MTQYISNEILLMVLIKASEEERLSLTKILNGKAVIALNAKTLLTEICKAGGHGFFNVLRGAGISYAELLHDACSIVKVEDLIGLHKPVHQGISLFRIDEVNSVAGKPINEDDRASLTLNGVDSYEKKLLAQVSVIIYERMTSEQRKCVDSQIAQLSKTHEGQRVKGLSTSAALIVMGNLGGFATYTLMSSILGALSMGTLSFGAYTFASSMLSVALGPVGWLALGGYALYKYVGPAPGKVLQLAATCSMIDQRLRSTKNKNA